MASTKQIKRNYSAAAVYPTTDRDPLQAAIAPPKDEDEGQRAERLRLEVEAKKINDQIDAQIALEREEIAKAKKRGDIKILLLGAFSFVWGNRNLSIVITANLWINLENCLCHYQLRVCIIPAPIIGGSQASRSVSENQHLQNLG
jgi:hypothetical protein